MSKQIIKIIILSISFFIMFDFFKNMFSGNDNSQELQALIKNKALLVDVRTPQEYAQGNVPGSINIPLDQIPNQLSQFKNQDNIVVFCRSGNRSGQAKGFLEQNGFKNVFNGGTWENVKAAQNEANK